MKPSMSWCSAEGIPIELLLLAPPRIDEAGPGWRDDEPTRLGRLARRLWDGLLDHEQPR